jgi:transposase
LKEYAQKLLKRKEEIVAGCTYRLNTSIVEGLNNTTKVLKRIAFGFHDHEYFFLKIRALSLGG